MTALLCSVGKLRAGDMTYAESRMGSSGRESTPIEKGGWVYSSSMPVHSANRRKQPSDAHGRLAGSMTVYPVIEPPRSASALLRDELLAKLDRAESCRIVLANAPAGYGKSTLLTQRFDALKAKGRQVAWLALEPADSDPVRFALRCIATLQACGDQGTLVDAPPRIAHAAARHGRDSGLSEPALARLMLETFDRLCCETWLFWDDLHLGPEALIRDLVNGLLARPLSNLHLVIATRQRPSWSLARMRTTGLLCEIGVDDLAYGRQELAIAMRIALPLISLSPPQIQQIHAKTEGWPAGVQLLTTALLQESDAKAFLARVSGADSTIAEFLFEEVMERQAPELRDFLLGTALLRRFSAAMANDVLQISQARQYIDSVAAQNLFLFPMDSQREWYRYHALFADMLCKHLHEVDAKREVAIHARAGQWFASRGMLVEGIEHALAIGDVESAGQWLDAASPQLFATGQTVTLRRLAAQIPSSALRRLPRLQLELAWENIVSWRFEQAASSLEQVKQYLSGTPEGDRMDHPGQREDARLNGMLAHRELMMMVFQDRADDFLRQAPQEVDRLRRVDPFVETSIETATLMFQRDRFQLALVHGQWPDLRRRFLEADAIYGTVFLDSAVGGALRLRGELDLAIGAFHQARDTAASIQGTDHPLCAMPTALLATALYDKNDLINARDRLNESAPLEARFGLVDALIARVLTEAGLADASGDRAAAHRALDEGEYIAERHRLPRLRAHVMAERARLLAEDGLRKELQRLAGLAHGEADFSVTQERLAVVRIRSEIENGEPAQALQTIRRWTSWLAPRGALLPLMGMQLLASRAHLRQGDRQAAQRILIEALKLASGGSQARRILDEGAELMGLLTEFTPLIRSSQLVDRSFLDGLTAPGSPDPVDKPTEAVAESSGSDSPLFADREIDILRLSAANLRHDEVAAALGISESTVKWYWQRMFEKTGLRKRALVLRRAREFGWLR